MIPIKLEKDREGGYKVTQGNLDSGCLAPDEALGIIAHALYGDGSPHRFMRPQATPPPTEQPAGDQVLLDAISLNKEVLAKALPNPAADADGWIEWHGGECPVPKGTLVDVKFRESDLCRAFGHKRFEAYGIPALEESDDDEWSATDWSNSDRIIGGDIIAYRLHKPEPTGIDSEGGAND